MLWMTKAHKPKIAPTRWSKVRPVLQNYSTTCRYYHQQGDQSYAQYSKIIRQPAAIITNQVIKSTSSTPKLFGSLPLLSPTRWLKVRPTRWLKMSSIPKLFGSLLLLSPTRWSKVRPVLQNYTWASLMSIIHKHSWASLMSTFMSITHINIHEHHSCQST